jgi:hypothetical protein
MSAITGTITPTDNGFVLDTHVIAPIPFVNQNGVYTGQQLDPGMVTDITFTMVEPGLMTVDFTRNIASAKCSYIWKLQAQKQ